MAEEKLTQEQIKQRKDAIKRKLSGVRATDQWQVYQDLPDAVASMVRVYIDDIKGKAVEAGLQDQVIQSRVPEAEFKKLGLILANLIAINEKVVLL